MDSLSADQIFRLHPRIRWAAFASHDGRVLFSQMRTGIESYTSEEEDRSFMELGPLFMTSLAERLTPSGKAGGLESVIVNLSKDSVLLMRIAKGHIAISAQRGESAEVFEIVSPMIRQLFG